LQCMVLHNTNRRAEMSAMAVSVYGLVIQVSLFFCWAVWTRTNGSRR